MSTEKMSVVNDDAATRIMPEAPVEDHSASTASAATAARSTGPAAVRQPSPTTGAPVGASSGTADDIASGNGRDDTAVEAKPERASRWRRAFGSSTGRPAVEFHHVPTPEEAEAAAAAAATVGASPRASGGPRRVRLAISRIDPWSVMKLAFLLSIAIGIALVIATAVVWNVLNTMQVFTQADGIVTDIAGTESFIDILDYVQFSRVISIAVVIAVVDVVILTAIATLFAFLYNVTAALVGGLHVTLTDE
jgi:hypothetical protein